MARRRTKDRHLPARVYLRSGTYYFDARPRWIPLGRDLPSALTKYASILGAALPTRTLGEIIDRYRIEVLPLKRSKHTRNDQGAQLERLKRVFGHMLPDDVTTQHCYRYADARRTRDGKPATVAARHEVALLGHIFAKAIRWGATTRNPVRAMERQARGKRSRYVSDAELEAVLRIASPRMRLAIELARVTGQRRGDLLSMRWDQVGEEGISVRQSKTGAGVLVEWSPELGRVMGAARAMKPDIPKDYVLRQRNGRPYSAAGFSAIWQRLMVRATTAGKDGSPPVIGERFTFHDLRAKAASDLPTIEDAAALLGHASSETTKRVYKRNFTRARPAK